MISQATPPSQKHKLGIGINYDDAFTGGPRVVYNFVKKLNGSKFFPVVITNKESELTQHLEKENCKVIVVPQKQILSDELGTAVSGGIFHKLKTGLEVWKYNRAVLRVVREEKLELFWARNIRAVLLMGLATRWAKIPLIWDIGMEKKSQGFTRLLYDFGFRLAKKVVTEADCVAQNIFTPKQIAHNREKLTVVKSGIPQDRVASIEDAVCQQAKLTAAKDSSVFKIINIATICDRKNQLMLVEAVIPLIKSFPDVLVSFVGPVIEQDYAGELHRLIAQNNADSNFEFLGWCDNATALLAESDLFVLTSKNEGVPYSILESMHAKVAVVATSCGGVPDVILDGKTGYIVEVDDHSTLSERIKQLMLDPSERKALAQQAADFVQQNHTADKWVASYMDLFSSLIQKSKTA